jgi:hypothetical protein
MIHQPTAKKLKKWSEPGTVMGILAAGKERKNQNLLVVCQLAIRVSLVVEFLAWGYKISLIL